MLAHRGGHGRDGRQTPLARTWERGSEAEGEARRS